MIPLNKTARTYTNLMRIRAEFFQSFKEDRATGKQHRIYRSHIIVLPMENDEHYKKRRPREHAVPTSIFPEKEPHQTGKPGNKTGFRIIAWSATNATGPRTTSLPL